ncbi:energy transducer TonB [Novosphingobium resinovorum]|uniref:energy transducer TonB n=1 Tax=Novosphingobium resinovorum TaxID=158500 RepID=UPI002ED0F680
MFIAVLSAGMGTPVGAKTDLSLVPTTPWNLDGTDAGCALRRAFGNAATPLILEMRRFAPADDFQFTVNGEEISGLVRSSAAKVEITYGDLPPGTARGFQEGNTEREGKKYPAIFLTSSLGSRADEDEDTPQPTVTPEMEAGARRITLSWGGNRVVLNTGSLGKPFAAMRLCTDSLVESWGLDPAVQNGLTRRARPGSLMSMVRGIQAIYPVGLAGKGKQARVNFLALVDERGVVTDCHVLQSYNDPGFDDLACRVVRKTTFEPALDKDGKPVPSFYAQTVMYKLG